MTVTSWDTLYCRVVFLEESILCTGEVAKQYAWNLYIKSKNDPELRNDILRSLVCSKNKSLLQIYLEKSIGGTSTRNQDIGPIVSAVAGSRMGFGLVMKFLSENIGDIHYRYKYIWRCLGRFSNSLPVET